MEHYEQIDGKAMDPPLVPTLANACLVSTKKIGYNVVHSNIAHFTIEGNVLFNSPEHLKLFKSYLNSRHVNISFTIENEKDKRMSFLEVNVIREKGKFTTSV